MNISSNNKRIAKNTIYLYIRMLLIMGVTLYTSRVVLQVLGVTDFGIYNVVGGIVSLLGFFTSSLSNAAQRYINIGLGKKSQLETEQAFKQSFTLMFILSVLVLIVGETVGLWFVYNKLVIPTDRLQAAVLIYHFSLVSVFFSFNQVALIASIVAHERMNVYAYLGLFEAFARLGIVYLLLWIGNIDSLVLYGGGMSVVSIFIFFFYLFYCIRHFSECKLVLYWNKKLVKEMTTFISYNLFGCFAWSAGIQGTNIILNMFFGPTVNAARAISVQVSAVVSRFTENIMTAVKPQIIKSYVNNESSYMILLIEKSSKYAFFFAVLLAIPIMFETKLILQLWLGDVPEYSIEFTRLILCDALLGVFAPSLWIAANATGNIKNNQVYGRLITLFILPLSYLSLLINPNPYIPFIITIFSSFLYWSYCLYDVHKQIGLSIGNYIKTVVKPSLILVTILFCTCYGTICMIENESFLRFFTLCFITLIIGTIIIYLLLDKKEREFVIYQLNLRFKR